jgi:hypothetical protein
MPRSSSEFVSIERPKTNSRVFAYTRWDAVPVAAALIHCAYFFGTFYLFPRVPLWVMFVLVHLFGEHFLEHQRHIPQLHSQSVFPVAATQSSV